jgi:hypothetical protein
LVNPGVSVKALEAISELSEFVGAIRMIASAVDVPGVVVLGSKHE